MRLRVVIIVTLMVAAYAAVALLWRQMFPFRDGLAEYLPEQTIAYVHVNLTPAIRRDLLRLTPPPHAPPPGGRWGNGFIFSPPPDGRGSERGWAVADALTIALRSPDVRELAFVWHRPEKLASQLALIIGQRASERPDVMQATTVSVGEQEIRTFVVRVQTSGRNPPLPLSFPLPSGGEGEKVMRALRRQPVQAVLWPRELPIPALDAARHLLPDTITASGIISRRGFVLRSDGQIPLIARSERMELLAESRPGTFQVIGLPVRALAEQLDLPFHGELRAAIEPILPETADFFVEGDRIAARIDTPAVLPPESVLRSIAARLWPIARPGRLDGLPASVLVADPDVFEIAQAGLSRWALRSKSGDARVIFAERSGDFMYFATDETLIGSALPTPSRSPSVRGGESGGVGLRMPSACHLDGQSAFIVWPLHPQGVVTMSVDQNESSIAFCGRIL